MAPTVQRHMGARSAGSLPHPWGPPPACLPHLGDSRSPFGGDALLPPVRGPPAVPIHPASCRCSCEELQDVDLELNADNSAFYDQLAVAQVGGAAQAGGRRALLGRGPFTAEHSLSARRTHPLTPPGAGSTLVAKDGARQRRWS